MPQGKDDQNMMITALEHNQDDTIYIEGRVLLCYSFSTIYTKAWLIITQMSVTYMYCDYIPQLKMETGNPI